MVGVYRNDHALIRLAGVLLVEQSDCHEGGGLSVVTMTSGLPPLDINDAFKETSGSSDVATSQTTPSAWSSEVTPMQKILYLQIPARK